MGKTFLLSSSLGAKQALSSSQSLARGGLEEEEPLCIPRPEGRARPTTHSTEPAPLIQPPQEPLHAGQESVLFQLLGVAWPSPPALRGHLVRATKVGLTKEQQG